MNTNTPQKAVVFNGNIDFTNQIIVMKQRAMGYRSRCEGKAISLYRNGELLADGTMSTGQIEGGAYPSLCAAGLTYHDDTFESFSADDTYTLTIGDEEPIGMAFVNDSKILTQELYDGLNPHILGVDNIWNLRGNGYSTFSIAQNVQTTKKKYDIKLLPEELLPKSVAKKSEVKSVERVANNALDIANSAQSTAQTAQSIASAAKISADKTTRLQANTEKTFTENFDLLAQTGSYADDSKECIVIGSLKYYRVSDFYVDQEAVTYASSAWSYNSSTRIGLDKGDGCFFLHGENGVKYGIFIVVYDDNPAIEGVTSTTITRGIYGLYSSSLYYAREITLKYECRGLMLDSITDNSTKRFKITVDDSGTLSATEVT